MFGHTTSRRPMPFHATSMTIILLGFGRCILYIFPIFLFHFNIIPLLVVP